MESKPSNVSMIEVKEDVKYAGRKVFSQRQQVQAFLKKSIDRKNSEEERRKSQVQKLNARKE